VGFGAIGGSSPRDQTRLAGCPHCAACPNGGRSMRLPGLAALRCGDEALFTTGRAAMFGSDDTGPNSSLVGRRKETPLFSPSGGTIGHDQRRERHAHRLVSTPAVARPYISPVRVTDQATGSTLTRVLVFVAERSCTKRYVTAALATFARASWLPRPTRTRQRGWLRPLSPMPGPSRNSCPRPDGPSTPVSRCVQELAAQVPARSVIAVPSRCTCVDCAPRRV
jgi:hypothetical protein